MPAPRINQRMTRREWAMLLTLSVLRGGSFFFVAVAVAELPPFTIVVLRVVLSALTLYAVARATGTPLPTDRRIWLAFTVMGLLNNVVPFSLFVWGQTHIASGLASIINATTPLFTVLVAHLWTRDEKVTGGRLIGVLVGFAGVVVIFGGEALRFLGTDMLAQLACLCAAACYAFAGVYGRRFNEMGIPPIATATGQVTAASAVLFPIMLAVDRPWVLPIPSGTTVASLLALALLSTALAYILYFRILATAGATNLLLVTFLIPVTAIVLGITILGEGLETKSLIGMGLIGLGLAAIDGRPFGAAARLFAARRHGAGQDYDNGT
jgi:drug/metabolite transporter (DMT)-like permease